MSFPQWTPEFLWLGCTGGFYPHVMLGEYELLVIVLLALTTHLTRSNLRVYSRLWQKELQTTEVRKLECHQLEASGPIARTAKKQRKMDAGPASLFLQSRPRADQWIGVACIQSGSSHLS